MCTSQVDLEQLQRRSKDTQWNFDHVKQWMEDETSRVLCVLAGAGTGKSTISAALSEFVLGRRVEGKPGVWDGPVTAYHFLKYSDARRLDPVKIIKSLAFQLAQR